MDNKTKMAIDLINEGTDVRTAISESLNFTLQTVVDELLQDDKIAELAADSKFDELRAYIYDNRTDFKFLLSTKQYRRLARALIRKATSEVGE